MQLKKTRKFANGGTTSKRTEMKGCAAKWTETC